MVPKTIPPRLLILKSFPNPRTLLLIFANFNLSKCKNFQTYMFFFL